MVMVQSLEPRKDAVENIVRNVRKQLMRKTNINSTNMKKNKRFRVDYHSYVSVVVEAKNEDEAVNLADQVTHGNSSAIRTLISNLNCENVEETEDEVSY